MSALVATVMAAATVVLVAPAGPASAAVTSTVTAYLDTSPRAGEAIFITGSVRAGSAGHKSRSVVIQYRSAGTTTWKQLTRVTTTSTGTYAYRYKPTRHIDVRAYVLATKTYGGDFSPARQLRMSVDHRTIESRTKALGWRAGDATTPIRGTQVDGTGKVRYQATDSSFLVETTVGSRVRTWHVTGEMRNAYTERSHVRGRLGVPLGDATCGLPGGGCFQHFKGGVIYDSSSTRPAVVYGTPNRMREIFAVSKSQVGYAAPSGYSSKYNSWVGTSNAWCSIYQSWVGTYSGHPTVIPKYGNFPAFHSWAMRTLPRGSTPKPGALAFFDTHLSDGVTAATHVGLVISVDGSYIHTIEGNTSNPATGGGRGVYEKTRRASHPLYYVYPKY